MTAPAGQDWSKDLAEGAEPLDSAPFERKKGKRAPVLPASEPADFGERAAAAEFAYIPIARLFESPRNPRKHYDPAKLAELAESVKQSGVLEALLVRPAPEGLYEIGAGHRRFRAAQAAGVLELPCRIREMDDVAFLELLNVSNLQRDDLHPLEEAQGYRTLMEGAGYDVARIAERVGRSAKYVYDRVKLLQLTKEAKKLFLDGQMTAGHAILLARLSPEHQADAIASERSGNGRIGGLFVRDFGFEGDGPDLDLPLPDEGRQKPVSVREFERWIAQNVRATPETVDPFLFPETAAQLAAAKAGKKKVIHITYDYRVPDAARDEKIRTYGSEAWHRADGQFKSKVCDHAVLGLVVAGPNQGQAFPVCIAKEKCRTHWADWQRERERRQKELAKQTKASGHPNGDGTAAKPRGPELITAEAEAIHAAVLADLLPAWKKAIGVYALDFVLLPDLLAWNLSQAELQFEAWAPKVGVSARWASDGIEYELEEEVLGELDGKFQGQRAADLMAAQGWLGFQVWRVRDGRAAQKAFDTEYGKREASALAAKAKVAPEPKPAPKKAAKPKKKGAAK